MKAGALNSLAAIQAMQLDVDEIGQPVTTWTTKATAWANIRHQSGAESIRSDAVTSVVKASIRIRYRADIDATMRVVHGATVYQITAVMPDVGGREYVDLVCQVVN